jgi:putative transposase
LTIKNINNENPLVDQHWEAALHVLEQFKDLKHQNKQNAILTRAYWDSVMDPITAENQKEVDLVPKSDRKSMQPGIKDRQQNQKMILTLKEKLDLDRTLTNIPDPELEQDIFREDLDDELYGD